MTWSTYSRGFSLQHSPILVLCFTAISCVMAIAHGSHAIPSCNYGNCG